MYWNIVSELNFSLYYISIEYSTSVEPHVKTITYYSQSLQEINLISNTFIDEDKYAQSKNVN
jgi:hypothetical protein